MGRNRFIRTISVVCTLTMLMVTTLPGCNFVKKSSEKTANNVSVVDTQNGNTIVCPVCSSTTVNGPDAENCYTCDQGHKWTYNQKADTDASNLFTGDQTDGGSASAGGSYNATNSGSSSNSGSGSSSGKYNGGSGSSNTVTPPSSSSNSRDLAAWLAAMGMSIKDLGDSVNIVYDEKTNSYTVINKDGKDTGLFGFKYNDKDKVFITAEDAWQRNFGFTETYDKVAGIGAISYDTLRVYYTYGGKDWMVQLWKGQYGFAFIGAEVGLYVRKSGSTTNSSTYYHCASDSEKLKMAMTFYRSTKSEPNNYQKVFSRSPARTWWLTGFTPGSNLSYVANEDDTKRYKVDVTMYFDTAAQAQAFANGLSGTHTIEHNSPARKRDITFTVGSGTANGTYTFIDDKTVAFSWR